MTDIPGFLPAPPCASASPARASRSTPPTGTVGIATDRLRDGLELTVTAVGARRPSAASACTIQAVAAARPRGC